MQQLSNKVKMNQVKYTKASIFNPHTTHYILLKYQHMSPQQTDVVSTTKARKSWRYCQTTYPIIQQVVQRNPSENPGYIRVDTVLKRICHFAFSGCHVLTYSPFSHKNWKPPVDLTLPHIWKYLRWYVPIFMLFRIYFKR